ncbi:hypothetical protein Sste5344_001047 [Sporothrix stenoceras]
MGPPTKESVLQAMRSDLGMTRVDDLELENGQRGHTVRTGKASAVLAKAIAPPRKILPVANKWKTAIESGAFDDDDAEAVKGLDRIGGGRLHAVGATPAIPAQYFSQQRMFPPGLPPPGFGRSPNTFQPSRPPPNMMPPSVPFNGFGQQAARFPPGPPPGLTPASMGFGNIDNDVARRLAENSPMPQRTVQVPANTARRPPPPVPLASEVAKTPRPQDPIPAEFAYTVNIRVADRLAKGEGAIYLVAPSDSDPGTFHIYLEGSKYIEYPIVSMFNYMTTSTDLCPQFKEADGASITTTRLVFGSQDRIATFMKELRALKARKPDPVPKVAPAAAPEKQPADIPVSMPAFLKKPAAPKTSDKESAPPATPANKPAMDILSSPPPVPRPAGKDQDTYEIKSTFNILKDSANAISAPKSRPAVLVLDYGNDDYGKACDLVDLSHAVDANGSRPTTQSAMSSTYAMDLGSLQESHFVTPADAEPHVFVDSVQASVAPSEVVEVEVPDTEPVAELAPAPAVAAVAKPSAEPPIKSPTEHTTEPATSMKATPVTHNNEFGADDPVESMERLQASLIEILPKFEAMSRILDSVEEKKREATAKSVFTNLRSSLGDTRDTQLSSAEQLLRALLVKLSQEKPTATKVADTVCHLRYARDEITRLREQAAPPPEVLFKLDFLPLASKPRAPRKTPLASKPVPPKKAPVTPKHTPTSSCTNNKPQSTLSPTAKPFQPSPPHKPRPTQLATHVASPGTAPAVQSVTRPLASPSGVPNSSISTNLESLTERMSRLTLPDSNAKTPTKGLQGSRWATATKSIVRTENANRFKGIIPP